MKPTFRTNSRCLSSHLAVALMICTSFLPSASADDLVIARNAEGVSYISGGVGTESIDRLNALASDFNLKLVFALSSGAYLSDVRVVIADLKGKTLLDTTSEGPWLLLRLPAGTYQVVASHADKSQKRQVAVAAKKLRTVDFRWRSE